MASLKLDFSHLKMLTRVKKIKLKENQVERHKFGSTKI